MQTLVSSEDTTHYDSCALHVQAVERVIHTMHTHIHELLTLEDMASVAYLSPSHFHRVFSRLIGVSPGEFLTALRFQRARSLLVTTSLSVTDICFEVGYTSTGSFTSRFTHLVGMSPRLLRQRAHAFEPPSSKLVVDNTTTSCSTPGKNLLKGSITGPTDFHGVIYVGLFASPIPQGAPVRCTRLYSTGRYMLHDVPNGVYHLRTAAFPIAVDLHSSLLPGEKLLVATSATPIAVYNGRVSGEPNLMLHSPRLTDPPLVMGLPLL